MRAEPITLFSQGSFNSPCPAVAHAWQFFLSRYVIVTSSKLKAFYAKPRSTHSGRRRSTRWTRGSKTVFVRGSCAKSCSMIRYIAEICCWFLSRRRESSCRAPSWRGPRDSTSAALNGWTESVSLLRAGRGIRLGVSSGLVRTLARVKLGKTFVGRHCHRLIAGDGLGRPACDRHRHDTIGRHPCHWMIIFVLPGRTTIPGRASAAPGSIPSCAI